MKTMSSPFLNHYKEDCVEALLKMNPEWDEVEVENIVEREMKKSFSNPSVEIDNNFKRQHEESSLLSIMDWADTRKPIIAGNGTFYKNHYEAPNPIASMLQGMLDKRKRLKKEMFKEDPKSQRYKDLDLS